MIITDAHERGLLSKQNINRISKQVVERSEEMVHSSFSISASLASQVHQKSLGHKPHRTLPQPLPSNKFCHLAKNNQIYHSQPKSYCSSLE